MEKSEPTKNHHKLKIIGIILDKRILAVVFLFLFIGAFLTQNYLFIKSDTGPSSTDNHFPNAMNWNDVLFYNSTYDLTKIRFPPVLYFTTQTFFLLRGVTLESARISLLVFAVIFLLSMFGIGYEYGGYYSGAAVLALSASSPLLMQISRSYLPDFPQTAMTALAFYLLMKCDYFKDRKYSILFGIALSLAFLTKWSTAFFMFIPLLWFVIPCIFKSTKSFFSFLIFMIPASITGGGIILFFKLIRADAQCGLWYLYFILIVFVPAILTFFLLRYLERKNATKKNTIETKIREETDGDRNDEIEAIDKTSSKKIEIDGETSRNKDGDIACKNKNLTESGFRQVINIAYMCLIFIVVTMPWYFWVGHHLKRQFLSHALVDSRNYAQNFDVIYNMVKGMFNFAPVLMGIGFLFILICSGNRYRRFILPVSLVLTALLMVRVGFPEERYVLALIIFEAALAGWWIAHTRWFRPLLAGMMIILSICSMFAWMALPRETPGKTRYQLWKIELNFSGSPQNDSYDMSELTTWVQPTRKGNKWKMIVFRFKELPFDTEYFQLKALSRGRRLELIENWEEGRIEMMEEQIVQMKAGKIWSTRNIDYIFIFYKSGQSPDEITKKILDILPEKPEETKSFDLGKGYKATGIRMEK
ncbi:MAG: glycosyltransferase family 39 protein [Candidatus Eremiobacteraeota bacterium]|nr:glycosyltransferase family 39 protein [Candidatus Eremiobacteraeota bacterium]